MGKLSGFERRLGGAVEGGFSRVFRSRVEPVELAVALKKEVDANRAVGPTHTLVPNLLQVDLGPGDFDRLAPYRLTLGDELAEMVREHASEQRYAFVGPVEVTLVRDEELRTGAYRISSRVEAADEPPLPPRRPAPVPGSVTAVIPRVETQRTYGVLELPDGEHLPVISAQLVLGRGQEADVRVADASVSRRHAEIRVEDGHVLLEDLGSTNGTTVNGERIARAVLQTGDRIGLGGATIVYRA